METPLKILMLEDNHTDAELIIRLITKANNQSEVKLATNRQQFAEALADFDPHVVVSDNALPDINGIEALEMVKIKLPDVPFILVTGAVSEEFAVSIIKAGAADYLLKDRLTRLPVAINFALLQKQTQKDQATSEAGNKLKAHLLNTIGQAVIATGLSGDVRFWNKAAEDLYGWSQQEALCRNISELIPNQKVSTEGGEIEQELLKGNSWSGEFLVQNKRGRQFPVFVTDAPIFDDEKKLTGIIRISGDISRRKKEEEDIKQLNEQLQSLTTHLHNVREEERTQIAKEMHDELGQQITGLRMEISWWLKKVNTDDQVLKEKEAGIIGLIDQIVKSVRRISSNLRPSILEDLGLLAALEWYGKEIEKRSGTKVDFKANVAELRMPLATSTELFRIYQELLSNAVHYFKAGRVSADLLLVDDKLVLKITDNGDYHTAPVDDDKKAMILLGVQQRIFLLEGQYQLKRKIGQGSQIVITIPYN